MHITSEIRVDTTVERAWAVLGEQFGDIAAWAEPVLSSSLDREPGIGAVRTCAVTGFGPMSAMTIHERLIRFDPAARRFAYEALDGLPRTIARAENHWSIASFGTGCRIRSEATLELRGVAVVFTPLIRTRLRADIDAILQQLRVYLEGRPA